MSAGASGASSPPQARRRVPAVVVLASAAGLFASACGAPDPGSIGGALDCRERPRFAAELGFTAGSALSTGDAELPGLVLVDVANPDRNYQHPSWVQHGHLGPFTLDAHGNVYVAPTPFMSLLESPPEAQNTIYRVDTDSGEMGEFTQFAPAGLLSAENPFGILGLTYDCHSDSLYASSVAGSSRRSELGQIVRIQLSDGAVVDSLPGIDAMGLAVFRGTEDRRLIYGSARRPEVWSVALDERGSFQGAPRRELALPEWSDRASSIAFDADGRMEIVGVPFAFNLAVGTDVAQENAYGYRYDPATESWQADAAP